MTGVQTCALPILSGVSRLKADRETVWAALNNPEVLKASIPGCESFEPTGENEFEAEVGAKIGPVKAKFKGKVELQDIVPSESYRLVGEGAGGAAGFAKGGAVVRLTDIEGGTELSYDVSANMGGKIAQLGARLMTNTAKKYADRFFDAFAEQVGGKLEDEDGEEADEGDDDASWRDTCKAKYAQGLFMPSPRDGAAPAGQGAGDAEAAARKLIEAITAGAPR